MKQRIAVIGSGTWGTSMALLVARHQPCLLWGRDPARLAAIAKGHHPQLGPVEAPAGLRCSGDDEELGSASLILWAVPTQYSRGIAQRLEPSLCRSTPVVSLSKGIERDTLLTVTQLLSEVLGSDRDYAALSGPSHAEEVLRGQPTGLVAAGGTDLVQRLVDLLHGGNLRIYTSPDLLGVELAGALKNVVAVAAGAAEGNGIGDNGKAMLISRGLAEMRRLGRLLGADDRTFAGLAGIGDLLTTCYSPFGRNRALGLALAKGIEASRHLADNHMVAEGAHTCLAAAALGERHGIEMPLASAVASVVWHGTSVNHAIAELMRRESKEETS
jgi:glycerol-3-phosphate dehydrogenase (NAD(P)+)